MNLFLWFSVHIVLRCVDPCSYLFFHPLTPMFGPILSVILYLTGSQRCKIVSEPIFISAFLSFTQTQVTLLLFHFCFSLHTFYDFIFPPLYSFTWAKLSNLPSQLCHWTLLSPPVIVLCGTPGVAHRYCRKGYKLHGFGVVSHKYLPTASLTHKQMTTLQAIHKLHPASSHFVLGVSHSS